MLLSKYIITILVPIVYKIIIKPCETIHNLNQLNEVKYSFLQNNKGDNNTPDTVTSGETVDVASNKVETNNVENGNKTSEVVNSTTTTPDVHKHEDNEKKQEQQPSGTTNEKEHKEEEHDKKEEAKRDEEHGTVDNKPKEEDVKQHTTDDTHNEHGENVKEEERDKKENAEENNNNKTVESKGEVENGHVTHEQTVEASVTPHQDHDTHTDDAKETKENVVNENEEHEDNEKQETETDKNKEETQKVDDNNKEQNNNNEKDNQDEHHEDEHGEDQHVDHTKNENSEETSASGGSQDLHKEENEKQETETDKNKEKNDGKEEHEDEQDHDTDRSENEHGEDTEQASPVATSQFSPQVNQTNQSDVKPHEQTPPVQTETPVTSVNQQTHNNGSVTPAQEPDVYKVDLKNLTDNQKESVRKFYEKPEGTCSVDCTHSCKSELTGSTQCVSQSGSTLSCSAFQDPNNLTCPDGYTPCTQPNVTTLKSFTLKKDNQEVGALEVDGSNFNGCMGLMLAPSNGVCNKDHLVHNLLFTSDVVNPDYKIQVDSDKLTFSNLTIKNGDYKVCLFQRYKPNGNAGMVSEWYKKLLEFLNPTHNESEPLKAVFVLEVGSLKVSD